jgi:Putative Flp pilus-assembly TadE/G-like
METSSQVKKPVSDTLTRRSELYRRTLSSRRGSVAVMIDLALPTIIGMVALGTKATFLLFKQRQMQSVADTAALGVEKAKLFSDRILPKPVDVNVLLREIDALMGARH